MNQLLVATRSRGKQAEFRSLLAPLGFAVVFPDDIGLEAAPEEELLERFDTFEENARAKAEWFAARAMIPTLADDSGLEVDALGGLPGVHSKRFAGQGQPDHLVTPANNAELLRRLLDVPADQRSARYRCVLLLFDPILPLSVTSEGTTEGWIVDAPRGEAGFGYDPLFLSKELGVTFGEAAPEAKALVSHRGRAARAMIEALGRGVDKISAV